MMPTVLMGSFIGVWFNIMLPDMIIQIILALLLFFLTFQAATKAMEVYRKENKAQKAKQTEAELKKKNSIVDGSLSKKGTLSQSKKLTLTNALKKNQETSIKVTANLIKQLLPEDTRQKNKVSSGVDNENDKSKKALEVTDHPEYRSSLNKSLKEIDDTEETEEKNNNNKSVSISRRIRNKSMDHSKSVTNILRQRQQSFGIAIQA